MENRFEHEPPEERQDWGAYVQPPAYPGQSNNKAMDAHLQNLCARVQEMLPHLLENDGEIRPEVASMVYAHIAVCLRCAQDFAEMQRVIAMVEALAPPEMPMDFSAIIMQRIQTEFSPARSDIPIRPLRAASSVASGEAAVNNDVVQQQETPQTTVRIVSNEVSQTLSSKLDQKQTSLTKTASQLWQRITGFGLLVAVLGFFLLSDWGRQALGLNMEAATSLFGQIGAAVNGVPLIGAIVELVGRVLTQVSGILHETYRTLGATTTLGLALDLGICAIGYYFIVARKNHRQIRGY
jgi:hypothetical protein